MEKKLHFEPHPDYVKAEQKDKLVRELSTINNMYWTYTAVALCVVLTVGFSFLRAVIKRSDWSKPIVIFTGCIVLMIILGKSYIKQTGYVVSRVKAINELNKEESINKKEQYLYNILDVSFSTMNRPIFY